MHVDNLRATAAKGGRDPQSIKMIVKLLLIVAPTDAEAKAKDAELRAYASNEGAAVLFGGCVFIYSRLQAELDFWMLNE